MAGIYIHIPFCKQACVYCNFHFSTNLQLKTSLVDSLLKEIDLQTGYLEGAQIESIYFGGGTPSLLTIQEIESLLEKIYKNHSIAENIEITFESNPDDLRSEYLRGMRDLGINRLSIGIQSFRQEDMAYMHRAHTPAQSLQSVQDSQEAGFDNISVDLIYGVPQSGLDTWRKNLEQVFDLQIQHLSCYALTVEPHTTLSHQIKMNLAPAPDDEETITQLAYLMDLGPAHGFEQYEISNFSRQGHRSRHNSAYWSGAHYLGIGPSAHSFNGGSRQWNVAHNGRYIEFITHGEQYYEMESLDDTKRYNEYIMTSIRTKAGISLNKINQQFKDHFRQVIPAWIQQGYITVDSDDYSLTKEGIFIADRISADLFF